MNGNGLITVERFLEKAGINEGEYLNIDFERFIKDFEISEDNMDQLNIERLLEYYQPNVLDVSSIFDSYRAIRGDEYDNGIKAIALMENQGTGSLCVYVDLCEKIRYSAKDLYLFRDLTRVEGTEISDEQHIIKKLMEYEVINWCSKEGNQDIADGLNVCFIILYDDDSVFRVDVSDMEDTLPNYQEVKKLLLGE